MMHPLQKLNRLNPLMKLLSKQFFCSHDYSKIETEPHLVYYDYTGFKVGVFKCKCVKCGKISNLKFY